MKSIRIPAALFLLAFALCAGSAMAQPQGPGPIFQESFTLTRVVTGTQPVPVQLTQAPNNGPYQVVSGEALKASKLQWAVDARCGTQLKSLSVKHPGGTMNFKDNLTPTTKNLQKTVTLQSFDTALIAQRCLDVANGTFVTAVDAEDKHELEIQQGQFDGSMAVTTLDGAAHGNFLLLSGACSSFNVTDKKHSAVIKIKCCVDALCG
ncbi:MAG TPA: hypothetical protein VNM67_20345 [Thermoanaerobaculia bacterium]|nr:hypothetical protein [Thermoanaerobaculia bacterium]